MRIIAGTYKRRELLSPKGTNTRPTTGRVRESAFNLIEARLDLTGAKVLDLFAGTGALGLEALSRGASRVVFVDSDPNALKYAKKNASALGVYSNCTFVSSTVALYLKRPIRLQFDLVFADPPYEFERLTQLPDLTNDHLGPGGLLIIEHDKHTQFDEHDRLDTSRKYGRTVVSLFHSSTPIPVSPTLSINDDEGTI